MRALFTYSFSYGAALYPAYLFIYAKRDCERTCLSTSKSHSHAARCPRWASILSQLWVIHGCLSASVSLEQINDSFPLSVQRYVLFSVLQNFLPIFLLHIFQCDFIPPHFLEQHGFGCVDRFLASNMNFVPHTGHDLSTKDLPDFSLRILSFFEIR